MNMLDDLHFWDGRPIVEHHIPCRSNRSHSPKISLYASCKSGAVPCDQFSVPAMPTLRLSPFFSFYSTQDVLLQGHLKKGGGCKTQDIMELPWNKIVTVGFFGRSSLETTHPRDERLVWRISKSSHRLHDKMLMKRCCRIWFDPSSVEMFLCGLWMLHSGWISCPRKPIFHPGGSNLWQCRGKQVCLG